MHTAPEVQAEECITLKWGTLKGWEVHSEAALNLLKRYMELGASMSAMTQEDTPEQKQILFKLVSLPSMKVFLDWDGKYVSQPEAVQYLANYGNKE